MDWRTLDNTLRFVTLLTHYKNNNKVKQNINVKKFSHSTQKSGSQCMETCDCRLGLDTSCLVFRNRRRASKRATAIVMTLHCCCKSLQARISCHKKWLFLRHTSAKSTTSLHISTQTSAGTVIASRFTPSLQLRERCRADWVLHFRRPSIEKLRAIRAYRKGEIASTRLSETAASFRRRGLCMGTGPVTQCGTLWVLRSHSMELWGFFTHTVCDFVHTPPTSNPPNENALRRDSCSAGNPPLSKDLAHRVGEITGPRPGPPAPPSGHSQTSWRSRDVRQAARPVIRDWLHQRTNVVFLCSVHPVEGGEMSTNVDECLLVGTEADS